MIGEVKKIAEIKEFFLDLNPIMKSNVLFYKATIFILRTIYLSLYSY